MRGLILLLLLLLAGCWVGGDFYTPADAVTAVPPGRYKMVGDEPVEPDEEVVRVSIGSDGMTRLSVVGEEPMIIGFAPLDPQGRKFVGWTKVGDEGSPGRETIYALLVARSGDYVLDLPGCRGPDEAVAVAAGAVAGRPPELPFCRFASRSSLERALLNLRPAPDEVIRLIPID
jgi:hypothetical protein